MSTAPEHWIEGRLITQLCEERSRSTNTASDYIDSHGPTTDQRVLYLWLL